MKHKLLVILILISTGSACISYNLYNQTIIKIKQ
jgi:hypothetical protein